MKKTLLSIIVSLTSFTIPVISFAHERYLTLQFVLTFFRCHSCWPSFRNRPV